MWLLLPALLAAAETRSIRAGRRWGPVEIDGKLTEEAWRGAEQGSGFTQPAPDEGAPASVATRFRVLWDEEAVYLGVECDDPEPPNVRLGRRDRSLDSDEIHVDLDTTLDRRTA